MKTPAGAWRTASYLLSVLLISTGLSACGGGGGGGGTTGSIAPGTAGPATVDVSIAAADVTGAAAPAVAVSGPDTVPSADPGYLWPDQVAQPDPKIAHVYMEVVKVSLMPAEETFEGGDMDGELQNGKSPNLAYPPDKPHFITLVPDHPIRIDLLNLKNGWKLARFLNKFDQIPAGTYDKIRVYYQNVTVELVGGGAMRFHPTAHSKFDIHFRQGQELVIPVTTDRTQKPDGWVEFFRVKLDVVGLKLKIVGGGKNWNGSKVILRPQIFAEFVPPILYSVAGTAKDVPAPTLPASGTFNVSFGTGPTVVPVAFNTGTTWAYSNNVLGNSSWIVDNVPDPTVEPIFRNRATVMAVGPFDASLILHATDIVFTFPDVREGKSDNVWIPPDNVSFIVRPTDNVTVFPKPGRGSAYYDNLALPHLPLADTNLDNNLLVRARGYFEDPGALDLVLQSYWISIGGPYVGP